MRRGRALADLAVVLVACLALGVVGLRVEGSLSPLSLSVPGTYAHNGETLAQSHFGDSSPFVVLLRRELTAQFYSPIAYVVLFGVSVVAAAGYFVTHMRASG